MSKFMAVVTVIMTIFIAFLSSDMWGVLTGFALGGIFAIHTLDIINEA